MTLSVKSILAFSVILSLNIIQTYGAILMNFGEAGTWLPIRYNSTHLMFNVTITKGFFIGIGFGESMAKADIMAF